MQLFAPQYVLLLAWIESWFDYPGVELWKFVNLGLFILLAVLIHRWRGRPMKEALRSRRERIKGELERARAERDAAVAKLAEVEQRLGRLDEEVVAVNQKARAEAQAEKERIAAATQNEIEKIREQSKREIEASVKAAKQELRSFAARESVRIAEGILVKEMSADDDARLTRMRVQELGGREA